MSGGTTAAVLVLELDPHQHATGTGEAQVLAAGLRLARRLVQAGDPLQVHVSGNGLAAAYSDPAGALSVAAAVASRFGPDSGGTRPTTARTGVSAGDVETGTGGWGGLAYAEAAALCRVAGAGQVLVSPGVAELVLESPAGTDGLQLTRSPAGPYRLEGRPAAAYGLPSGLAAALEGPLVGRQEELTSLLAAWRATLSGTTPAAVFLGGEPGIGKSRLLADLAQKVLADGALVLWGAADTDSGYGPVADALARLAEGDGGLLDELSELGSELAQLARLVPGLTPAPPPAGPADEMSRLRLFDAVASVLSRLAGPRPVLVLLEDLHAAGPGTVALLRHLLRRADRGRLMVVASFRSTEVDRTHPLFAVMADLTGAPGFQRLHLAGLGRAELEELVADRPADPGVLLELTGGNPLFALSVLEGLGPGTKMAEQLPSDVKEVLAQRVARLTPAGRAAVELGSVAGVSFDLDLLERAAQPSAEMDLLDGLEEAVAAGLVRETDPGRFVFAHGLIPRVVLQSGEEDWAAEVHLRLARLLSGAASELVARVYDPVGRLWLPEPAGSHLGLVGRRPGDDELVLSCARHWLAASRLLGGDPAEVELARSVVLAAGVVLDDRTAYDELVDLAQSACEQLGPLVSERDRAGLTLRLSEGLYNVGQMDRARQLASDAAEVALGLADSSLLAWSTLAYAQWAYAATPDPRSAELHDLALGALASRDDDEARRLLAGLKASLAWQWLATEARAEEAEELARAAVDLARGVPGAEPELFHALAILANTTLGTDRLEERKQLVAEALDLIHGDLEVSRMLVLLEAASALERGDTAGFARLAEILVSHGEGGVWIRLVTGLELLNTVALIEGRLADADAGVARLGSEVGAAEYHFYALSAQLAAVRREQGRGEELMGLAPSEPGSGPILFPLAGALLRAEAGQEEAAARTVELVMDRLDGMGRDAAYTVTVCILAECAALLARTDWVPPLVERLRPLSGLIAVGGYGTVALGAVDRFLGMLAATRGEVAEAVEHYRAAMELEERAGSPTWAVRTRMWWARALDPDDPQRAELLERARADAEALGMRGQAELAARLSRAETSPA